LATAPAAAPEGEKTLRRELFKYPRSMAAACLTGPQTSGVGLLLWITTLFVLVLKITPAEASYLMIWVTSTGILGRIVCSYLSDAIRRRVGHAICFGSALFMMFQRRVNRYGIGVLPAGSRPTLLRRWCRRDHRTLPGGGVAGTTPGEGLDYDVGNLGKIFWPLGLAVIVRLVELCEPAGESRRSPPLSRLLVGARRRRLLVYCAGDEGSLD
jgi:MFS transporter, putative metabolite:H+ symporter